MLATGRSGRLAAHARPARERVSARAPRSASCIRGRAAAQWAAVEDALFVVAQARLVMVEEDLADEVAAAAHAGPLEDVLQVLLHGVG